MVDTVVLEADSVRTADKYKEWTRAKIRPVFPHETLGSGYAHAVYDTERCVGTK